LLCVKRTSGARTADNYRRERMEERPENELGGDGILSAIDCKVTLEKKGERGVITIDAKFLHYKEF
jgi:hypothetical protein